MNEIKSFSFFDSYYEAVDSLTENDKKIMLVAIVDYVFKNKEPQLNGTLKALWTFIKLSLDTSKKRSKLGQNRNETETNEEQNENKTKSKEKQNKIKKETNEEQNENILCNHNHNHNHNLKSNSNNLEKIEYEEEKPLEVADDTGLLAETTKKVIEYLNKTVNTNFRASSKMTKSKIQARLNDGYRLNDFTVVIEKKAKEWIGTEFEKYLCPETLFGNKFEKYLNQKETTKKKTLKDIPMSAIDKAIEDEQRRLGKNE